MSNRLADEVSPYLLQHKDNPVDWYPWGEEALARAASQDKPILLSVGYAACHWCHVMEHESFEDPATADLMNELFVCIKVDREERPDIDAIYMEAVQAMTGHGGWPMTIFLTSDGRPFYGGTYFPPRDHGALPAFSKVLTAVGEAWRKRRLELESQGDRLIAHIDQAVKPAPSTEPVSSQLLYEALRFASSTFDREYGGFGAAPKFPQPMTIDFLLRLDLRGDKEADEIAAKTLDAMAAGGILDQLGGGFARYSVDRRWIVPHFEKMLYDNAQLLRTYARSWQIHGTSRHKEVATAIAEWLLREMHDRGGGFWSSLDADSEGIEGKFYVWSLDEVREVTGEDFDTSVERWGFSQEGNFEGSNIPVIIGESDPIAVKRAARKLLERRATRPRPATDSKVLAGWNGLTASALAEAGVILGERRWVEAARDCARFLLDSMVIDGRLMRSYRLDDSGRDIVKHLGYCEDYAFLLEACLSLFEATHDGAWLEHARWSANEALRLFWDDDAGGFFSTGTDAEALVMRPKDLFDNAVPSANSVMALQLQKLSLITSEKSYLERALDTMRLAAGVLSRSPLAFGHMLEAIEFHTAPPIELVIVGKQGSEDRDALVGAVRNMPLPNKVLIVMDEQEVSASDLPLVAGRTMKGGHATAYVCRNSVCRAPVTDIAALRDELEPYG
ncbi:MAG TPA: thioredoxin domain-containing protein [Actinomycetota bacterium]|nr:thioredoxin domain-containing protein [Actinomycetota bacterium]